MPPAQSPDQPSSQLAPTGFTTPQGGASAGLATAAVPDMQAIAHQAESDHARIERLILAVLVVVLIALAAGVFLLSSYQRKTYGTVAPPTPITTVDIRNLMPNLTTALNELDTNLTALDASLGDQQGDLGEQQ